MATQKATTLAQHGFQYRLNGFPIFDDWEAWYSESAPIIGYMQTDRWPEANLTPDHWNELAETWAGEMSQFVAAGRPIDDIELLYILMESEGIEHEHVRGEPIEPRRPARGYFCRMCKGAIWIKDPGDYPFYGGPADGRWIVTDGRDRYYVPVIPPISVAYEPDDVLSAPVMTAAVYVRRGDRYIIAE